MENLHLRVQYTWKVVVNRSKYDNIGTIGNSGRPPTTSGHVPVFLKGSPQMRTMQSIPCKAGMSRISRLLNGLRRMDMRNSTPAMRSEKRC